MISVGMVSRNFIGKISILFITILILSGCHLFQSREGATDKVENTDLSEENINGIVLLEDINDIGDVDPSEEDENKAFYYNNGSIYLEVNSDDKIVFIRAGGDDRNRSDYKTQKGINNDSTLEEVTEVYGEDYYEISEQGMDIIGYVDKVNYERIEFWLSENKVAFVDYSIIDQKENKE